MELLPKGDRTLVLIRIVILLLSDSLKYLVKIADHAKEIDITVDSANESNPEPDICLISREILGRYCQNLVISELCRNASITLADAEKLLQVKLFFFHTSGKLNEICRQTYFFQYFHSLDKRVYFTTIIEAEPFTERPIGEYLVQVYVRNISTNTRYVEFSHQSVD